MKRRTGKRGALVALSGGCANSPHTKSTESGPTTAAQAASFAYLCGLRDFAGPAAFCLFYHTLSAVSSIYASSGALLFWGKQVRRTFSVSCSADGLFLMKAWQRYCSRECVAPALSGRVAPKLTHTPHHQVPCACPRLGYNASKAQSPRRGVQKGVTGV